MRLICAFTCDAMPVAKQRHKSVRRGAFIGTYTPKPTVEFEAKVHALALDAMAQTRALVVEEAVALKIDVTRAMPKSWSKKKRAAMIGRWCVDTRDLDNQVKAISDGMNKAAFMDDRQVAGLMVWRLWGENDHFRVALYVEGATDGAA